jgi:hypothetical protein
MSKRDLLKLPDDFDANVRALLGTPPAPHHTAGSRKAPPKPPKRKAPKRKAYKRSKAEAAAHRAAKEQGVRYAYESAPVRKPSNAAKKRAR